MLPQSNRTKGERMSSLGSVLNQLRNERMQAQQRLQKFEAAIIAIEAVVNGGGSQSVINGRPKRHLSAAARRRIAQAQRARWAEARQHKAKSEAENKPSKTSTKRTMPTAARRKIAAFQKARWAKVRAQQRQQKKAA